MNLWILTEERPKIEVLEIIIQRFLCEKGFCAFIDNIRILPIIQNNQFIFSYEVTGIKSNQINKIFLKIVSGNSSFVDYLVFFQDKEPDSSDTPIYAIEETKTDDSESRNTGVYQRITKFVYINFFYPNIKKIMLYNLRIKQKEKPTQTYIFGTKLLRTLGVEIIGKHFESKDDILKPFKTIKDLIEFKNQMRKPPRGNVPIVIKICDSNVILISGRLEKNKRLAHDPNIGALSGIAMALRILRFNGKIEIISHGLKQDFIGKDNKFIQIANFLNISLQGLNILKAEKSKNYWHYEKNSEKLATIFIHLVVEHFSKGYEIFENHAGCEKGYFLADNGESIPLQKYENREKYKAGDKNAIAFIPDLILLDPENLEIINIEGKTYQNRFKGIEELKNYDFIENEYIKKYYPAYKIIRSLVLFGGDEEKIVEIEIGLLLNAQGKIFLGIKAPEIFIKSIKNLFAFWKKQ